MSSLPQPPIHSSLPLDREASPRAQATAHHLMLVPSLACPAACAYCFGPHQGQGQMSIATIEDVLRWQQALGQGRAVKVTFHGGEPLVPGIGFYRATLPRLRVGLAPRRVELAMQSNLWLLTDELCDLFREHGVALGTSLDGPEPVNDAQRGAGYYRRTMAGIERARRRGLRVGCICTFTRSSLPHAGEIMEFFRSQDLEFSIHAAVPSLGLPQAEGWSLSAAEHGALLVDMLDRYLPQLAHLRISTLDQLCRSVSTGEGATCNFTACLGGYLAVGPDGSIYPCQRFAGLPAYAMAHVRDAPSREDLESTPLWRTLAERQERVAQECGDCAYFPFCRGGCAYNALARGRGAFNGSYRDPHCAGYKRIFAHIADRALQEVLSEENMALVVERPSSPQGLLRKGRLLSLLRGGPHPHESAGHARQLLAAVALAAAGTPEEASRRLEQAGAVPSRERAQLAVQALSTHLHTPRRTFNNLYLHVTLSCNLRCTHCYASAGDRGGVASSPHDVARACCEAAALGFRHAVITGGEPLVHPQRDALLDALAALRPEAKPLLTVLRTNLAVPLDRDLLRRVAGATDQMVVSVDGDEATHDARRGAGSYATTTANLRALVALRGELGEGFTDLSLAAVLPLEQVQGAPGEAVRALARELGIRRTRFRPLLPLGRAAASSLEIVPETLWGHLGAEEAVAFGFAPAASCGMGQNLYVEPDGQAFPCYAWHGAAWSLGYIYAAGLRPLLEGEHFRDLAEHTVDTNRRCRLCALRYLCGGACRAWARLPEGDQDDLDAPPLDCAHLLERARAMLVSALQHLDIPAQRWQGAGLPLPDRAPVIG